MYIVYFQLSNYNIICLPMICFQRHNEHFDHGPNHSTEPELQRVTK